jgi:mannose-6-phosphate isomerase-like protein (cupin superfamily)
MNKQGKIWGFTSEIFSKNNVEVHRIEGNANSHCSKHMHEHKYNMFFVESGTMVIERWKNDYKLVDSTVLTAGQSCVVPPCEYHQFFVQDDCVAYEFYWVEISSKDIVRESVGGVNE